MITLIGQVGGIINIIIYGVFMIIAIAILVIIGFVIYKFVMWVLYAVSSEDKKKKEVEDNDISKCRTRSVET